MSTFKRTKVVMLPTNQKATQGQIVKFKSDVRNLVPNRPESLSIYGAPFTSDGYWEPQHLYILSDEEIKEGDWCFEVHNSASNAPKDTPKFTDNKGNIWWLRQLNMNSSANSETCKKIIATTDSSLKQQVWYGSVAPTEVTFPQPSSAFIEKYVELYNKGKAPEYVMVEYESKWITEEELRERSGNISGLLPTKYYLKVNPKDNTITIKAVKDNWNREEVALRCAEAVNNYMSFQQGYSKLTLDKWIEENL